MKRNSQPSTKALRLGFWSAMATAIVAAVFAVAGVLTPPRSGPLAPPSAIVPYPYTDVAAFIPMDYLWLLPGLLLVPIFVVLMACIHRYATDDRKIFSQIGLAFATVYAAVISIDYFMQFAVVIPSILSGEVTGLSLFTQYNPHGFFITFEALGYMAMSAALFAAAPVFAGGKIEGAIRWLFVASFVLAIATFVVFFVLRSDLIAFEVSVLTVNWVVLIISGSLLSIVFKRAGQTV